MTTTTLSRRTFIKTAAAAGGGLMLSFYLPARGEELLESNDEAFAPNVWIKIGTDGSVTITVARSEMGQGVWTSMSMIVAEELDADWAKVSVVQADAHPKKYGSQSTGGSWSVRGSWQNLRTAGATGREMLKTAAARTWNVDPATCRTGNGYVTHSSGKKLSYGELATTAASVPAPSPINLKDPKDFVLLGKRIPKLDTPSKTHGEAIFGIDVRVPGMVFSSLEKCPVFGGTLAGFDATAAKKVAGVLDVVQIEDSVAVVADSTWAAFKGREALSVRWNDGQWANQTSEQIRKTFSDAATKKGDVIETQGDIESALASAATRVEGIYEVPFVAHATMEPMNCVADVRSDRCEIWAPSQSPQGAQREAARILNLPVESVVVHVTLMGGGFGRRLSADYAADAVRVSKAIGKPVMNVWTREDDMQHDLYRPMTYNVLRGGLDKNGNPIAWHHRIAGPNSRGLVVGGSKPSYSFPNYLVDAHLIDVGVPVGAWRSVGPSQNGWVMESFVDELAHAAKADPFEFRRKLLGNSPRLKRTLEYVAEKAGWGKKLSQGVGRGISCVESFGSTAAQVAEVSVDKNGTLTIHRIVIAVDCGPVVNPDTIEAQLESAVVYALSAALKDEITVERGRVQQSNFDDYRILQIDEMPKVEVHIVPSTEPVGGIGEPGLPPVSPAVCNAIFAATGKRIRKLPIRPADLKT